VRDHDAEKQLLILENSEEQKLLGRPFKRFNLTARQFFFWGGGGSPRRNER
jgi:hypothetical protein